MLLCGRVVWLLCGVGVLMLAADNVGHKQNVTIGLIVPNNDRYAASLHRILPVVRLAIDRVHAVLMPNYSFNVTWTDLSDCSATYGPLSAVDMRDKVQVFFGPVCIYDLAPVVRFTNASWGIPILTSSGKSLVFDNKTEYALMTRMNGFYGQLGDVMTEILRKFNWNTVGLFYSDLISEKNRGHSECYFSQEAFFWAMKSKKIWNKPPFQKSFDESDPDVNFRLMLEDVTLHARIITICASARTVRRLLLTAESMGLLDSGEWVFINIELAASTTTDQKIWEDPMDEGNNTRARKAFESVLTVRPRTPTTEPYLMFSNDVKRLTRQEFPDFRDRDALVNPEAASFYEALLLYVAALKEAVSMGYSAKDGRIIHELMKNRTLPGIVGNFTVDSNNDRHVDYSILDMEPTTGLLKEVATYWGMEKKYAETKDAKIHWPGPGGLPPADTPECGFDGSKCQPVITTWGIVSIVLSVVVIALLLGPFLIWRHFKKESDIAMMTWLIKYDELDWGNKDEMRRSDSKQSLLKVKADDTMSVDSLAMGKCKQIFAPTATYRKQKQLCAVKRLNEQHIPLSRPLLIEFKMVQGLQHEHLARFIGACFDSVPPCLLFEYCPKGSLEDILENEEIQLDWMFRYSLMHDLTKGMNYIHGSELRTHGNLKSSNCVVDSRFVLKITDYGPHCMREAEEPVESDVGSHAYWKKKLWTAPELLRQRRPNHSGTQKGDVYSFAIIAQEIIYRNGPFYISDTDTTAGRTPTNDPKEIIDKVIQVQPIPFRPTLESFAVEDQSLVSMIEKAWSEDPNVRPDFNSLRTIIRRLNRDNESGNILDNLLKRMEQYANNLESLVAERTADYLEQKRKAEELLYQLLPAQVAGQLIKGQPVKAESYDSVTIYFSDIVGFTTLSALSTPMQVVNFLNDLYTCFDAITMGFDVYKVETIGDAYVVVSGLPLRNGDLHAREIARMSLSIIEKVKKFEIRHRPNDQLRVRIGMHTGPVVAGVVGLKMPRYCLFGDTVNTASRMESNSLPLRIHCSEACRNVLVKFGSFDLELRGELDVKGKGQMVTYWLNGEHPAQPALTANAPLSDPLDLKRTVSASRLASHTTVLPTVSAPLLQNAAGDPHRGLIMVNGPKLTLIDHAVREDAGDAVGAVQRDHPLIDDD
ncbi:atrial natriuretic peptide receptor 1-like [Paramacrobiotus metropolitanus]|uniref:atrial natriuretic peptide receptor 1-like n=1 Tax=Paramacrobiotus metropolitanus TaxID=2943436 RepID=UPI002445EB6F|nr:atrial natriuretic peptide receptor 1-like [Paramacrobiotus metropolitanus]